MDRHTHLGLESGTVRVVSYHSAWPTLFATEAERLRTFLGNLPLELEHTGSTAVPGLAAKPIIDILAGHPPGSPVQPYIDALERAGYLYRGEQGIPGRHFFRRGDPRSYHVHLAPKASVFWREHITFRDALRRDDALRDHYAALKLDLASRFPRGREAYIDGKTDFVLKVLGLAS
jgi:GrpB-like predicted nucleotidyltransferase (UPF0157 family)